MFSRALNYLPLFDGLGHADTSSTWESFVFTTVPHQTLEIISFVIRYAVICTLSPLQICIEYDAEKVMFTYCQHQIYNDFLLSS